MVAPWGVEPHTQLSLGFTIPCGMEPPTADGGAMMLVGG